MSAQAENVRPLRAAQLPEWIEQAPATWGRVSAWNRWLVDYLAFDEVLDKMHEESLKTSGKPESFGDALKHRERQREKAASVAIKKADLWRALASEEAAIELARILFRRTDREPLTREDVWDHLPEETFFLAFYTLGSKSEALMNELGGYAASLA